MRASQKNAAAALVSSAAKQAQATGLPRPTEEPAEARVNGVASEPNVTEAEVEPTPEPAATDHAAPETPKPSTRARSERTATAYGFAVPKSALDTDQTVQLGLRIPKRLHAALRSAAYLNDLSLQDLAAEALTEKLLRMSGSTG